MDNTDYFKGGFCRKAAVLYESIGYRGPFSLAVDATAVIPTLRIKGNTVYGLATELKVIATTAQDVIDIVRKPKKPMYLLLV